MATYYLEGVVASQLEYIRRGGLAGVILDEDWRDGTVNVCVDDGSENFLDTKNEDLFVEWCESQGIAARLL